MVGRMAKDPADEFNQLLYPAQFLTTLTQSDSDSVMLVSRFRCEKCFAPSMDVGVLM